ncbi:MAG: MarR family transcriptional regulator, organic hydroperoxide resistance regulator [Chloroflexota bacterium]|jgi:DNA-binding MarR family transcriptional regulator|nr:MarR family transcriptional regulator, organic hydroperoxide resistance regulator [Chloroflexota bacterium]MEA2652925.1 MarR family transcriptional regulator, organic hydroperoxide resistance regulator [Chloroflexota bacterium]
MIERDGMTRSEWVDTGDDIAILAIEVARQLASGFTRQASERGLTFPQAFVIRQLGQPMSMKAVAERLHCDASNLTGIVDRLEARGLVVRRSHPTDRRVKELVLTDAGERLRDQLDKLPPYAPGLSELSADDRATLVALLQRTLASLQEDARASER